MLATVASELCRNILYTKKFEFGDGVLGHACARQKPSHSRCARPDVMLAASGSTIIQVSASIPRRPLPSILSDVSAGARTMRHAW